MHVAYSLVMLFKGKRKKRQQKELEKGGGVERCIHFTYTRQQTK